MRSWLRWLLELPALIVINAIMTVIFLREYVKVVYRYYGNKAFRRADLALIKAYLWSNPYRIHRHFLEEQGAEEIYRYGETLLTTMEQLTHRAGVSSQDTFIELGCGRGRCSFWVRLWHGCRVIGIDYVPLFISKANSIKDKLGIDNLEFYCRDFLIDSWEKGSVYYVDATLMEGEEITTLLKRCHELTHPCRLIAVNFSLLGDYPDECSSWKEISRFTAPYPWGLSEVAIFHQEGM